MNKRIVSFLAGVLALLTFVGGLDLTGIITLLPDPVAKALVLALPLLAGFKHLVTACGDFADDGQINGSFKLFPFLLVLGVGMMFALSSCAALGSAATGQPIPATPVQRAGGEPFNVADTDIHRAEASPPETVWGLYNAGALAARAREVIATK